MKAKNVFLAILLLAGLASARVAFGEDFSKISYRNESDSIISLEIKDIELIADAINIQINYVTVIENEIIPFDGNSAVDGFILASNGIVADIAIDNVIGLQESDIDDIKNSDQGTRNIVKSYKISLVNKLEQISLPICGFIAAIPDFCLSERSIFDPRGAIWIQIA